jgi:protein tyrosine/serine phosphatase
MSEASEFERVDALKGIYNFRDYGDYAVRDGGRLKRGTLFRSGQHLEATPEDLQAVHAIGLASVIDLRGGGERAAAPCPRPEGFTAQVFHVTEETGGLLAPHLIAAKEAAEGLDAAYVMREGYATMPFRWRMKGVLGRYFEALDTVPGPSLVHCMAGKDRTGLAVALLHLALGVHEDDAIADYLLTNTAGDLEARVSAGARQVRESFGTALTDEDVRMVMMVRPEYLKAAIDAIIERHGSIRAYLRDHLGVDEAQVDRIAGHLIA